MKISHRLVVLIALFITCLITANVVAIKIVSLGFIIVPAAVFVFPFSYLFGDVLTEVYGYAWSRRVIWLGFFCNFVFVFFVWVGQKLPAAGFWDKQQAYNDILGSVPRILLASFAGYLVGEFVNSFVLSRLKVLTRGRWLWTRTIGSTIAGQALDTAIFITIAFGGTPSFVPIVILYHWSAKVTIEIVATPATYFIVNWLKTKESIDVYDRKTNFTPFSLKAENTESLE
jgi:uncharacterized integral membrane protein (TIGR00697 family)